MYCYLWYIIYQTFDTKSYPKGALWIADKNGVFKTKSEAQALVDAEIQAAQAAWDAQTDEEKAEPMNTRPSDITLP